MSYHTRFLYHKKTGHESESLPFTRKTSHESESRVANKDVTLLKTILKHKLQELLSQSVAHWQKELPCPPDKLTGSVGHGIALETRMFSWLVFSGVGYDECKM